LGCSRVPDYIQMRDNQNIVFCPTMYDNLVAAVTKKFTAEVLPQFHNSLSFQIMVYALMITGFFNQQHGREAAKVTENDEHMPSFKDDPLVKGLWPACVKSSDKDKKEETKDEDESESSSSSSSTSSSESESDGDDDDKDDKDASSQTPAEDEKSKDTSGTSSQPPAEDEKK